MTSPRSGKSTLQLHGQSSSPRVVGTRSREGGCWRASGVSLYASDLLEHVTGPGPPQVVHLAVDSEGRIVELGFQPSRATAATLGELTRRLATIAETSGSASTLAHPSGNDWGNRRVKNDERDARDLADLLRLGRLAEAWIAPPVTRELRELVRTGEARPIALGAQGADARGDGQGRRVSQLNDRFGPGWATPTRRDATRGRVWCASSRSVISPRWALDTAPLLQRRIVRARWVGGCRPLM